MYTHSMETIYLSVRAQVAVGTFFMKSPVLKGIYIPPCVLEIQSNTLNSVLGIFESKFIT